MLTLKSNLFKNKRGQQASIADLQKLAKVLIVDDFANVSGKDSSHGFTYKVAKLIIKKITLNKDAKILILNDITLEMFYALLEAGYKRENIYIAFGKWNKDATVRDDNRLFNIMKNYIRANFEEEINVIELKEIFNMKFNLVIANPPYGAIGANIAYTIREKVDYEYFVNLLPANDYKRNKAKDLFNYQSEMEPVNDGFDDAAVTTHLCLVSKNKVNNMTLDEFERSQYIDPILDKYFEENSKRKHYAIDTTCAPSNYEAYKNKINVDTTFIVHTRDINHQYIPYKGKAYSVNWNINKIGTIEYLHERYWTMGGGRQSTYAFTTFNTALERNNYTDFMLKNGWKFMCKIFKALNADGWVAASIWAPKVDWTHSWTVEEILADYGYTEEEIKEVMEDLKNFKGMDD